MGDGLGMFRRRSRFRWDESQGTCPLPALRSSLGSESPRAGRAEESVGQNATRRGSGRNPFRRYRAALQHAPATVVIKGLSSLTNPLRILQRAGRFGLRGARYRDERTSGCSHGPESPWNGRFDAKCRSSRRFQPPPPLLNSDANVQNPHGASAFAHMARAMRNATTEGNHRPRPVVLKPRE